MTMKIHVSFPDDPQRPAIILSGRDAWAMMKLAAAGEVGVTPIDTPGPRWSGYVHNLRRAGFNIETRYEPHGPPFPGTHARYVLQDRVVVRELSEAK